MSDRSVHASAMRENVVVTGDGNTVVANFGDSGARLSLERRQVRGADRRRRPRSGELPRELDVFAPDVDVLPLLGRDALLTELREWLDDPADLSVHALIGEAGSGKTRLALELCRAVDPADGSGAWRGAFVRPSAVAAVVDALVTRSFAWDRQTLLVLDYAATAHEALGRWLDSLAGAVQAPKLRFLLLERQAPAQFGWWPALTDDPKRRDLFWGVRPVALHGLAEPEERRRLLQAAQAVAHRLRGQSATPLPVPEAGADAGFDRLLHEPRYGNPLNLVMAGVIACDHTPLGALGLRRLDAAAELAKKERRRLVALAASRGITEAVIRHMLAFNGLAGGLPVADLPGLLAAELAAWGTQADARAVASLLDQEFPLPEVVGEAPRLGTVQPDLIGETVLVHSFEGEAFLSGEAVPTVRRAYAIGKRRSADALVRVVQDFAYALEEQGATEAERTRGAAVLGWVTALAEDSSDPVALFPLVDAMPAQTLVLREPAARLTASLAESVRGMASDDPDIIAIEALLLNNLGTRLSALGRREEALAAAAEAVALRRGLASARPDAFTADLASSLNNLGSMLRDLGRREEALASAAEAERLYRGLASARPDAFTADLAQSLNNLGTMLSDLGRREEALAAAAEAVALRRGLASARPDAFTADLARSLNNLGNRLSNLGRREEALAAAAEAVGWYRGLASARPDAFTADLARSLWVLGDLKVEAGEKPVGIADLAEAVRLLAPVFATYPAAVQNMMLGVARSYISGCEAAEVEPDEALLAPVVAVMERLQEQG